jgi:hypothetical protein
MTRRQQLEAMIERAIAALDAIDGDPDLEPETIEDSDDAEPIEYAA